MKWPKTLYHYKGIPITEDNSVIYRFGYPGDFHEVLQRSMEPRLCGIANIADYSNSPKIGVRFQLDTCLHLSGWHNVICEKDNQKLNNVNENTTNINKITNKNSSVLLLLNTSKPFELEDSSNDKLTLCGNGHYTFTALKCDVGSQCGTNHFIKQCIFQQLAKTSKIHGAKDVPFDYLNDSAGGFGRKLAEKDSFERKNYSTGSLKNSITNNTCLVISCTQPVLRWTLHGCSMYS